METLLWILLATFVDGLVALVGVFTFGMKKKTFELLIYLLVAFSAGALLGGAFFHLLIESAATMALNSVFICAMIGFSSFFVLERGLKWHHCHSGHCEEHQFTYLILIGDAIHNIIDGLVIAASFLVNVQFGILSTVMILCHEVPQELGDYAVLIYGGFEKKKALAYNLLSQLTCVIGGIAGFYASGLVASTSPLLAFAAGGFIYISATDLIPELHKEKNTAKAMNAFAAFLTGIVFMFAMKYFIGE